MNFSYIRSHSQKLYKCLKLILLQEIRCIYKLWFRLDILKNPVNLLHVGYRMNVVYGKKLMLYSIEIKQQNMKLNVPITRA